MSPGDALLAHGVVRCGKYLAKQVTYNVQNTVMRKDVSLDSTEKP